MLVFYASARSRSSRLTRDGVLSVSTLSVMAAYGRGAQAVAERVIGAAESHAPLPFRRTHAHRVACFFLREPLALGFRRVSAGASDGAGAAGAADGDAAAGSEITGLHRRQ